MVIGLSAKLGWAPIKVEEKMSSDVECVGPDISLADIGKTMRDQEIGCILVKENGQIIGIITDRDMTCRAVADCLDPATVTARAIMSKTVCYCFDDAYLSDAAHIMQEKQIRRRHLGHRRQGDCRQKGGDQQGPASVHDSRSSNGEEELYRILRGWPHGFGRPVAAKAHSP